MKLPGVSGVFDYAGPDRNLRYRSRPCCLPRMQKRQLPGCIFSELNTQPTCTPVYASPNTSRCATQNSGPSGSLLLVGLFHSLLHAGLSRRTALAIWHQVRFRLLHFESIPARQQGAILKFGHFWTRRCLGATGGTHNRLCGSLSGAIGPIVKLLLAL
jgi:hypothetical protein